MNHLTAPLGLYPIAIPSPQAIQHIYIIYFKPPGCTPGCRNLGPWLSPSVAWMKVDTARRQLGQPSEVSNWVPFSAQALGFRCNVQLMASTGVETYGPE